MILTSFFVRLRKDAGSVAAVILSVDGLLLTLPRIFFMAHEFSSWRTSFVGNLTRQVNRKMMGRLPFGNVGRGKRASQEARGAPGNATVNVVPQI
jgi:hypothetical protein